MVVEVVGVGVLQSLGLVVVEGHYRSLGEMVVVEVGRYRSRGEMVVEEVGYLGILALVVGVGD